MKKKTLSDNESPRSDGSGKIPESILLGMYRNIYATRQFELACIEYYRQGLIRGYLHPYLGEEAIAAGACAALRPDDYIVSTHRGHGHCIGKGADLRLMMAEIMGKATGYCRGRGGSMHISSTALNNLGANGIVGGGIPIATGAAMGIQGQGHRPGGGGLLQRRGVEQRRVCRIAEPGGHLPAAGRLRAGEQPLRRLDAHRVRHRLLRPGRPGPGLRCSRASAWTATMRWPSTAKPCEAVGRARRGRGPDPDRGPDLPSRRASRERPRALHGPGRPWPNGRRATR